MTKHLKLKGENLFYTIGLRDIVTYWFLWEKLPMEWARTLLVIIMSIKVTLIIVQIFTSKVISLEELKK